MRSGLVKLSVPAVVLVALTGCSAGGADSEVRATDRPSTSSSTSSVASTSTTTTVQTTVPTTSAPPTTVKLTTTTVARPPLDEATVTWWLSLDATMADASCAVGYDTVSSIYSFVDRDSLSRLCDGEKPVAVPVTGDPLTAAELEALAGPAAAWMAQPSPVTYDALAAQARLLIDLGRPLPSTEGRSSEDNVRSLRRLVSYPGSDVAVARALGDLRGLVPSIPFVLADGSYRVGTEVPPGTYRTVNSVEGCYWETLDEAAEINDNNFVLNAPQVIMRIRSSDFAVNIEDCGVWVKTS